MRRRNRVVTQCGPVLKKHMLLAVRQYKLSLSQLIAPIVVVLFLVLMQAMSNAILSMETPNPLQMTIGRVPRCHPHASQQCVTIAYSPRGVPWVDEIMRNLSHSNGLVFDEDVIALPGSAEGGKALLTAVKNLAHDFNNTWPQYLNSHRNETLLGITFTGAYADMKRTGFMIWYNATGPMKHYHSALEALRTVDEHILKWKRADPDVSISAQYAEFPKPKPRFAGYDVVSALGGVYFFLPSCLVFFVLLTSIVEEKEKKLRIGMRVMGLSEFVYWSGWVIQGIVFSIMSALILMAASAIASFDVFIRCNQGVMFITLFLFGLSMASVAMMISSLINKVKTAQAVGYGVILLGFVFQSILTSGYGALVDLLFNDDLPGWVVFIRIIFLLYPPFNFAKIFSDITYLAGSVPNVSEGLNEKGPGFFWADLYKTRSYHLGQLQVTSPPPYQALLFMLMNVVVWGLLTIFVEMIKSGTFQRIFQRRQRGPETLDSLGSDTVIKISNLNKTFGKTQALNDLSFSIKRGEIFALLGHNGAGKTTALSVLCGLVNSDSGNATVDGYDCDFEQHLVRTKLGVTWQHDILWDELTAAEHLRLFAAVKGIYQPEHEVAQLLEMVNLTDVADHRTRTFSGGMKRRLSVAIAQIGTPPVILLDEPSTGLDPISKKQMWDLIEQLRKTSSVLLTTHSMEEVEVLADRIAIMNFGNIGPRNEGTILDLKERYGLGYNVSVLVPVESIPHIMSMFNDLVPDAQLKEREQGSLIFKVEADSVSQIPSLLKALDAEKCEWGISETSLEEVFLETSRKAGFVYELFDESQEMHAPTRPEPVRPKKSNSRRVCWALFSKNARLQWRQVGTNLCQLFTPLLVLLILFILQMVINSELGPQFQTEVQVPQLTWPLNASPELWEIIDKFLHSRDGGTFVKFREKNSDLARRHVKGKPRTASILTPSLASNVSTQQPTAAPTQKPHTSHCGLPCTTHHQCGGVCNECDPNTNTCNLPHHQCPIDLLWSGTANVSSMLARVPRHKCRLYNHSTITTPSFRRKKDYAEMNGIIFSDLRYLNSQPMPQVGRPPDVYLMPDGFVAFDHVSQNSLNYSFATNDHRIVSYHRKNNFTRMDLHVSKELKAAVFGIEILKVEGHMALMSMVDDAFGNVTQPDDLFTGPLFSAKFAVRFPDLVRADVLALLDLIGVFLYPVALSLQIPIFLFILVMEKATPALKTFMQMHGMHLSSYYLANYLFFYLIYLCIAGLFWLVGYIIGLGMFATSPDTFGVFLLLWGFSEVSLAFFLSTFVNSRSASSLVGYLVALFGTLLGEVLALGVYALAGTPMPTASFIWPQFGFVRGIYLLNDACALQNSCYGPLSSIGADDEFAAVLFMLAITSVMYFVLFLYLDQVYPRTWGVAKHPLLCFEPVWRKLRGAVKSGFQYDILVDVGEDGDLVDDAQIEKNLADSSRPSEVAILTRGLSKRYPGAKKQALVDLSIVLEKGGSIGLLGSNGAGKSTTIGILTGLFPPSGGEGYVNGFDVQDQTDQVRLSLGFCPQFSILWDLLTVREHLLLFCRLKGIPSNEEGGVVERSLRSFGLHQFRERRAGQLSGGMQRRLSVAIALTGDSRVVFLDEMTTGLDPVSTRQIWSILSNARGPSRSLCITSHSMVEAEVLCQKIVMLGHGSVRAVGSPLYLKNKFASGYRLLVSFHEGSFEEVDRFLKATLGETRLMLHRRFLSLSEYHIDIGKGTELIDLFEALLQKPARIKSWALGQKGLEDVFEKVFSDELDNTTKHSPIVSINVK